MNLGRGEDEIRTSRLIAAERAVGRKAAGLEADQGGRNGKNIGRQRLEGERKGRCEEERKDET